MVILAVLITCYNRKDKTLGCLQSLFAQRDLNIKFQIKVFLVDDGSSDGTSAAIGLAFPEVRILKGTGNLFWNRGMYLAWKTAAESRCFDHYLWLNDDTFLFENAISTTLNCASETKEESIICGTTLDPTLQFSTYGGYLINQNKIMNPTGQLEKCDFFNGNFVLVPEKVFEEVGNLDPIFHHALGDIDYGLRARKKKIKSYISTSYIGTCDGHDFLPSWCSPQVSLRNRLINLYSSSCYTHPFQFFRFEKRHYGLGNAVLHFFSIHVRAILPGIWVKKDDSIGRENTSL
jgi:GT2 family glycosyltransferase